MNKYKKQLTLGTFLVSAIIFVILLFLSRNISAYTASEQSSYTTYQTAKVVSIESEKISLDSLYENNEVGSQSLLIEITSGQYKGMTMTATNFLGALYGTKLKTGSKIVVSMYISEGEIGEINVYEINRTFPILLILAVFILITVLIGKRKGAQSLLGLVFTVICLIWILIPLLMNGAPSVLTTLLICIYVSVVSYAFLEGITPKTLCAIIGTIFGLLVSVLFALVMQKLVHVDGMRMGDYIDALLQLKQGGTPIELKGLLIDGMLIASLGAIMDVAMSIASAIQELVNVNPNLSRKELWKSGMNIGQDIIGTMTNTLILAFMGSSFVMVLYIWSLNIPSYELLSSPLVAIQVVHSIASSIGVILSVPLTVFICTFFYGHKS